MSQSIGEVRPEFFCSAKCPQMDLLIAENAIMYANDEIYTREVAIGCKNAKLCKELRKRIVEDIEREQAEIRATHVVEIPLTRQLKDYVRGPRPGDHGKWGALNMEQRHFLIKCVNYMEAQEYTIQQLLNKEG